MSAQGRAKRRPGSLRRPATSPERAIHDVCHPRTEAWERVWKCRAGRGDKVKTIDKVSRQMKIWAPRPPNNLCAPLRPPR